MSRLVDGEPFEAPLHCRCGADAADAKYIGPHETATRGDYLLLATCRSCLTTFVQYAISGASKCSGCGHLILGCDDDTKCCVGLPDGSIRIVCLDCAPKMVGIREAFGLEGAQAQLEMFAEAARVRVEWRRRRAITLGEVRAQAPGE